MDQKISFPRIDSDLRTNGSLCEEEESFSIKRKTVIKSWLEKLLGCHLGSEDEVPTIGALFSGGGVRAMMATSAAVKSMDLYRLLDVITYSFCISGSTWYWTYLYSQDEFGVDPLVFEKLHQRLKSAVTCKNRNDLLNPQYHTKVIKELGSKLRQKNQLTLNDLYENFMSRRLLGLESGNIKLSEHKGK